MPAYYNPMLPPQQQMQQMQQLEQRLGMFGNPQQGSANMMYGANPSAFMQPMAVSDNSGINWVNGFEGAKAALIPIDKPVLLMDSTDSKFYIKQINAQGTPVIQAYRFFPEDASTQVATQPEKAEEATSPVATHNEQVFLEKLSSIESRLQKLEQKEPQKGGSSNVSR